MTMISINFKEFKIYNDFTKTSFNIADTRKLFVDGLYNWPNGGMIAHTLCHKIWDSEGEVEINEDELNLLKTLVEMGGNCGLIDGLNEQIKL